MAINFSFRLRHFPNGNMPRALLETLGTSRVKVKTFNPAKMIRSQIDAHQHINSSGIKHSSAAYPSDFVLPLFFFVYYLKLMLINTSIYQEHS